MFTAGIEKSIQERITDNIDYCDFKYFLMEAIGVTSELQLETKLKMILLNKMLFYKLLNKIEYDIKKFFENLSHTDGIEFIYNKRFASTMRRLYFTNPDEPPYDKYIAEQEQLLQAQMEIDLERQRNKIAKQREIIARRKAREEAKKLKNATRRTK
jgi:hypothetical protein